MRLTKIIAIVALALVAVLALAACAGGGNATSAPAAGSSPLSGSAASRQSADPQPPPSQPTITGKITKIAPGQGASKLVTVQGAAGAKLPEAIGVVDESNTLIIQKIPNGGTAMMQLASLKAGQTVQLWLAQPLQGKPPMGTADALEVQP